MVIRCAGITLNNTDSKLRITYHGEDGEELSESFDFSKRGQRNVFNKLFGRRFANSQAPKAFSSADEVIESQALLSAPDFVIARKQKHFWQVQERVFDYQGSFRKAY
jgi:DNA repair protein RadD